MVRPARGSPQRPENRAVKPVPPRTDRSPVVPTTPPADAEEDFREDRDFAERDRQGRHRTTNVRGIGDEAFLDVMTTNSSYVSIDLVVREGTRVVDINYDGWNKTFLGSEPMPVSEAVEAAAAEILRKP